MGDAFDHTALAGGIAAFKDDHQTVAGTHHPVLQFDQFTLQSQQFAKILFAPGFFLVAVHLCVVKAQVVQFHFQLFVIAVVEFLQQALVEGVVVIKFMHSHS
ncbi:hypothetical protein D3C78_1313890 [compost metagenome]